MPPRRAPSAPLPAPSAASSPINRPAATTGGTTIRTGHMVAMAPTAPLMVTDTLRTVTTPLTDPGGTRGRMSCLEMRRRLIAAVHQSAQAIRACNAQIPRHKEGVNTIYSQTRYCLRMSDSVDRLYDAVTSAKQADPAASRTARLLRAGRAKMAKKLAEEAVEVVIDAMHGNRDAVVRESADLIYNLVVL